MSANETLQILSHISRDDPLFWSLPTTINCNVVRLVGLGLCLAAFAGIVLNGSLLLSFIRYKALRTPPNIFIMFMSGVGLLAACVNLPMSGSSSVFCRWLYSRGGCYTEGLVAFLYGCASCYLLCAVSLSRCYIIVRPFDAKAVTVRSFVNSSRGSRGPSRSLFGLGNKVCHHLRCGRRFLSDHNIDARFWME